MSRGKRTAEQRTHTLSKYAVAEIALRNDGQGDEFRDDLGWGHTKTVPQPQTGPVACIQQGPSVSLCVVLCPSMYALAADSVLNVRSSHEQPLHRTRKDGTMRALHTSEQGSRFGIISSCVIILSIPRKTMGDRLHLNLTGIFCAIT